MSRHPVAATLLCAEKPAFATLQDSGRRGWMRWGVSGSGAMDVASLAAANALVGNRWDEAAIEFALTGGEWLVQAHSCRVAITGGAFRVLVDGQEELPYCNLDLRRGQRLRIWGAPQAVWGYLAVQGGFDVEAALGSRSTQTRAGLGGVNGAVIEAGQALALQRDQVEHAPRLRLEPPPRGSRVEIRVLLGPQEDHFTQSALRNFLTEEWQVSNHIDRMGYHLRGATLTHNERGANIVSDGIVAGSIQVPGSGQPIVLMKDCQPTGGYPKIATVLTADLGLLAQARPGSMVRFQAVTAAEAERAYRDFAASLAGISALTTPSGSPFGRRRGNVSDLIFSRPQ